MLTDFLVKIVGSEFVNSTLNSKWHDQKVVHSQSTLYDGKILPDGIINAKYCPLRVLEKPAQLWIDMGWVRLVESLLSWPKP